METSARILVADDDANCRNTTIAFLVSHGYQCDSATTGDEVIALLGNSSYDLLLSDIEMPGNSDLSLIQTLTQTQAELPVILMTGYPSVQTAANSFGLSVVAYLIKPVDPQVLLSEVTRSIELSRSYRKIAETRERLLLTCEELKRMESSLLISSRHDTKTTMTAFLDLTIQNVAASLLDLRQLFETMIPGVGQGPQMEWLQSARPLILINALRETISVLAKTKRAFRSKELAELRRKLESLLQEQALSEQQSSPDAKNGVEKAPVAASSEIEVSDSDS
jgi:DNA-binding response OmpR family regulator